MLAGETNLKISTSFYLKLIGSGHGKGVVDGIGGEAKSIVCQQVLSKMKNVIV